MGQSARVLRLSKGASRDAENVKRQVDNNEGKQKPIYELLNVNSGGGKLIEIIKSSAKSTSGSFNLSSSRSIEQELENPDTSQLVQVDREIYNLVKPLLYNEGRGKLIPLSQIWRSRLSELDDDKTDADETQEASERREDSKRFRWVCWKLEERGFVGETGLHICFLVSTPTHMILARKLLNLFPMLINDIYTCDQYFGESSLHMAIVHEDVRIVRLLLDHGANVHERCLGSFFLPDDQKDDANWPVRKALEKPTDGLKKTSNRLEYNVDIDLQSNHLKTCDTNFHGYAYWGEYPLSFAACLGSQDCYKLLLAKGANPNRQDSNGNSTLHMTVIANRRDMFDLCYANGANLDITNKQGLTPLTLAAKLKRVDLFFHILTIQRQVNWIFCNVGFVEVPLWSVDSINSIDGSSDDFSALSIVVSSGSNEHLQMLDGCLGQLLKMKWECGVRQKFYSWLYQFIIFISIALLAYIKRFEVSDPVQLEDKNRNGTRAHFLLVPTILDHFRSVHVFSEYLLVCYVLYYLWFTIFRLIRSSGVNFFYKSLAQAPEMTLFTFTCLLILICIPFRLLGWKRCEDFTAALVMFTIPLKLLFFCRASMSVGSFVVMIYKIVVNDVLCFVVFLIIFVAGFSQSFLIMFKSYEAPVNKELQEENHFTNLFDGLISMHMMALNEFGIVFDQFQATRYSRLAKLMFCIYMILVSILLINMLIAMLGKTYQDISSQPNESRRQWARALLIIERMWTRAERLEALNRYSRLGQNRARFYGSTWPLTDKDREEIERLNELREENRVNAARLARLESSET